eukprot:7729008-Pyramimonas_sp.AAC.1
MGEMGGRRRMTTMGPAKATRVQAACTLVHSVTPRASGSSLERLQLAPLLWAFPEGPRERGARR